MRNAEVHPDPADPGITTVGPDGCYRKRPIQVTAARWTGSNEAELAQFTSGKFCAVHNDAPEPRDYTARVYDHLHDSWLLLRTGDWVVRGPRGECYPVAADVFAETYEPVPDGCPTDNPATT